MANDCYFRFRGRNPFIHAVVNEGRPLGCISTRRGRMIVFRNSHVHKLIKMQREEIAESNNSEEARQNARRRIIAFKVVDLERHDIATSRDVSEQQGLISREDALKYRAEMMDERKKQAEKFQGGIPGIRLA